MGLLIGLVVIGLMAYGVLGLGFFGWASSKEQRTKDQAPQILDDLFNGQPNATYRTYIGGLPFETVVLGAEDRGYKLTHDTDDRGVKVLIFKLVDPAKVPAPTPKAIPADPATPWTRDSIIMIALGVGTVIAGLVIVSYAPQVAAVGVLAMIGGAGLAAYGIRLKRAPSPDASPRQA